MYVIVGQVHIDHVQNGPNWFVKKQRNAELALFFNNVICRAAIYLSCAGATFAFNLVRLTNRVHLCIHLSAVSRIIRTDQDRCKPSDF